MKLFFLLSIFIVSSSICFSQTDDIKRYLDDGGRTDAANMIKIDLTEVCLGNYQFIGEHRFTSCFALQAGIGHLSGKTFINPLGTPSRLYSDLNPGFSLFIAPVYYFNGLESFHYSLPVLYKCYSKQATSVDAAFCVGKQWFSGRHFAIDIQGGIGLSNEKSLDGVSYIYNSNTLDPKLKNKSRLYVPISLKVGYVF